MDQPWLDRLSEVRWDRDRRRRRGFAESVLGLGKSDDQLLAIAHGLEPGDTVVFTRLGASAAERLREAFPGQAMTYDAVSGTLIWGTEPAPDPIGRVAVLAAGTADVPVAREAEVTLRASGISPVAKYDVGVAGLDRLFRVWPEVRDADVLIVVAGMDGALASVVGGLSAQPVIAVPTSVGYGAHFGGLAPLLSMLNSCAEGVAVVNIDNGFGAARLAAQILRLKGRGDRE